MGEKSIGVILTYNCARLLEDAVSRVPKNLFDELIIIDDGSSDETILIAKKLGLPFFTHPHFGYGGNIKYGLRKAVELGAVNIIELHGDGQFDPNSSAVALRKLRNGYDLILGSRFSDLKQPIRDGMSMIRYLGNFILSTIARWFLGLWLYDFFTGFRGYSQNLVKKLNLGNTSDDYFFSFQITALAKFSGLKIGEVAARCDYKKAHTSINLWKGLLEIFQTPYTIALYYLAKFGIRLGPFESEN